MKSKKITPQSVAPVKRENVATVSRDGNAIAASYIVHGIPPEDMNVPWAGDDAE